MLKKEQPQDLQPLWSLMVKMPSIVGGRAEAVMRDGGIRLLLDSAKSSQDGLQLEAAKAIASNHHPCWFVKVHKEAAGGLWNFSIGEDTRLGVTD